MKIWIKFGCFLTGWNYNILQNCSEASFKKLKKYTASLFILIIIWSFIGFCFAQRYVQAPFWGCVAASVVFVAVIIQIERQIILAVHTKWYSALFRVVIALIMSVLGAAIIDQIIFKEDIEKKLVELRDDDVQRLLPARLSVIEQKLGELRFNVDSIYKANNMMNEELAKNPTIVRYSTQSSQKPVTNENGVTEIKTFYNTSQIHVENPRQKQIAANEQLLDKMRQQQEDYTSRKIVLEEDLRAELSSKTGFLEELRAILTLMSDRVEALIFYIIVMLFFTALELLVLVGKIGDSECDYEMVVRHQLEMKAESLKELRRSSLNSKQ